MASRILKNLALSREIMLYLTTDAVNDAVAMALKEQPLIPSNLINVAGRQRICPMVLGFGGQYSLETCT